MIPGHINGANARLGAPNGMNDCIGLFVRVDQHQSGAALLSSVWHPTPDELAAIVAGAPILLTIYGSNHPPVQLGVSEVPAE